MVKVIFLKLFLRLFSRYFNIVTKECGKFIFNGCSGNLNNFATYEQCTNFCFSAGKN